jgi:hypothetical protein
MRAARKRKRGWLGLACLREEERDRERDGGGLYRPGDGELATTARQSYSRKKNGRKGWARFGAQMRVRRGGRGFKRGSGWQEGGVSARQ